MEWREITLWVLTIFNATYTTFCITKRKKEEDEVKKGNYALYAWMAMISTILLMPKIAIYIGY